MHIPLAAKPSDSIDNEQFPMITGVTMFPNDNGCDYVQDKQLNDVESSSDEMSAIGGDNKTLKIPEDKNIDQKGR